MFSNIKNCPFCGSKNVKIIKNNELSTNFYVEEIITDLKVSFSFLKKKLKKKNAKFVIQFFFQLGLMILLRKKFFYQFMVNIIWDGKIFMIFRTNY